ncbi:sodium-dependent transporter [Clostridium uliginosum]|uniref:Neurotransmitter:Na+ symporter, NSS family n=1 Tax=Clostridium uliginosum TaxID=119641 RepID=A0A1I1R579_9CLOT|nr:sodium-dependent transporter [Clostridium uliginosum]SFD29459.1 neurotransmitter:Na+ symporter, NSS family [Clostridium uliginosum]
MDKREGFSSRIGFVLSCIGAAIGLGNVWMFPYKLGENGGAAFLIPYFFFVIILGIIGLITEFSFGRQYKQGSLGAIRQVFKEKNIKGGSIISVIPTVGLTGIFMFYVVVIGWVLKYFYISLTGKIASINTEAYFANFANSPSTIVWHALAVLITLIIVSFGVANGIERINKIVIPLLFVIFILLIVKSFSLPGSDAGIQYLLKPQWSYLLMPKTWVMAMGQAFFTVSITGCCMVVCGSYADKKFDILNCAVNTAFFDTLAALLAGFMIMPAVFALGLNPTAGPALMFVTVPSIFQTMPFGNLLSSLFFLSIIFASVSSSIAMLEGPVEAAMSITKWSRKKATIIIAVAGFILGIPLTLSGDLFNKFTNFITIILSPIGAVITAFIFYYIVDSKKALEGINEGARYKLGHWFINFGKYVFVPATIIIIILGIIYGGIG